MEIEELRMLLDLNVGNEKAILKKHAQGTHGNSYIFVDSNGKCWLFDETGKLGNVKIKLIKRWAFSGCTSLTSIKIPDSVESIGYGAFADCTSLASIEIPDSVKNIRNSAFSNCEYLTSIKIPDSVESIGYNAFWNCTSLKAIIFKRKTFEQVKSMYGYRYLWGIEDESIIKVA